MFLSICGSPICLSKGFTFDGPAHRIAFETVLREWVHGFWEIVNGINLHRQYLYLFLSISEFVCKQSGFRGWHDAGVWCINTDQEHQEQHGGDGLHTKSHTARPRLDRPRQDCSGESVSRSCILCRHHYSSHSRRRCNCRTLSPSVWNSDWLSPRWFALLKIGLSKWIAICFIVRWVLMILIVTWV